MTVQVGSGETAEQLAPTLLKDGVVASTRAFVLAAENSTNPTGLEPGFFILNSHMQATVAWAALLNPKNRDQAIVTIPTRSHRTRPRCRSSRRWSSGSTSRRMRSTSSRRRSPSA